MFQIIQNGKRTGKEYINLAEKAIQIFSQLNDDYELARAYFLATYYHSFGIGFGQTEDMEEQFRQKSSRLFKKSFRPLSQNWKSLPYWRIIKIKIWGVQHNDLKDLTLAIEDYRKAIKYGKIAKSNYVITGGSVNAAFLLLNQALVLEDPIEQKEKLTKAIELIQKAKHLAEIAENILYFWVVYRQYNIAINLFSFN